MTIGTIVYFKGTDRDTEPKPAMILRFDGETADLNVFGYGIISYVRNARMASTFEEAKGGEWVFTDQE